MSFKQDRAKLPAMQGHDWYGAFKMAATCINGFQFKPVKNCLFSSLTTTIAEEKLHRKYRYGCFHVQTQLILNVGQHSCSTKDNELAVYP